MLSYGVSIFRVLHTPYYHALNAFMNAFKGARKNKGKQLRSRKVFPVVARSITLAATEEVCICGKERRSSAINPASS